ncbi:MAG: hypothetical protein K2K08_08600 [Paramuribaculum sp.]|nr:hypothetical protein [Paramuribaculum sp.]
MKYLTYTYKIANVAFGFLIALYFAFQAARGFIGGHIAMSIAMTACALCGCFIFNIARKEYSQLKKQNR